MGTMLSGGSSAGTKLKSTQSTSASACRDQARKAYTWRGESIRAGGGIWRQALGGGGSYLGGSGLGRWRASYLGTSLPQSEMLLKLQQGTKQDTLRKVT